MLIGVILVSALVMMVGFTLYSRTSPFERTPRCPNCHIPYLELVDPDRIGSNRGGPRRTYDVLACPQCTNTTTRVYGTPSRFAYCPSCNQRTLETPARRLAPTLEAPLAVEVEERCHVCGYAHHLVLPPQHESPASAGRGKVIPFPGAKR
ncbi:MAG: hypothetical protein R3F61_03470 [Myxococcota bacterium]